MLLTEGFATSLDLLGGLWVDAAWPWAVHSSVLSATHTSYIRMKPSVADPIPSDSRCSIQSFSYPRRTAALFCFSRTACSSNPTHLHHENKEYGLSSALLQFRSS